MTKVRTIRHNSQTWANLEDLRVALNSDDMVTKAGAMLKVSIEKGDTGIKALRMAIAYFLTEGTGALAQLEN
jgi:hypothetical protein